MIRFSPARLRQVRRNAGIRPEVVAIATDRSVYAVASWERGLASPSADTIATLATVLACEPNDLFDEDGAQ
jgi:hypothetical protein